MRPVDSVLKGCLESASVSVLVNGSPTREFLPRKGLRQGDPLAPFLFLIVAEGLAGVTREVEEKKLIDSLEVGKDKVKVNMLQYADDTLFFSETNTKSIFNLKAILQCFELASGLRVNFAKSRIGGTGMDQVTLQSFAAILNCDTMVSSFIYLGMPVGGSHKRGAFWNGVLEKVQARLNRWKGRSLSMAGRICLIRSVLSSIPLFFMSLFKLPAGVARKLIRLQRDFLWGWGADGRKIAWVSWNLACKPREFGGLGIIDPKLFNLALLGKWIWRLGSVEVGLWKEVLLSKYGGWRSLGAEGTDRSCSLWWKDLKEVWSAEGWGRSFEDSFDWKVGVGKDIYFWKDRWLKGEALKNVFPRLFSISSNKEAKLLECGNWSNGRWVWKLAWRRSFFEWESQMAEQLGQLLVGVGVVPGEADSWVWKAGDPQSFSVSSAYKFIRKDTQADSVPVFRKLWRSKAVPSAALLAWRVLENKLATRVNLSRRGVQLESLRCVLCGKEEESCSHLFFGCTFAWRVWCLCYRWLGALFVAHIEPRFNFDQFRLFLPSKTGSSVWNTIWIGVVSEIWSHRNTIIFKGGVVDVSEVFALVQVKVWSWVSTNSRLASFSFSDWCLEPLECLRLVS